MTTEQAKNWHKHWSERPFSGKISAREKRKNGQKACRWDGAHVQISEQTGQRDRFPDASRTETRSEQPVGKKGRNDSVGRDRTAVCSIVREPEGERGETAADGTGCIADSNRAWHFRHRSCASNTRDALLAILLRTFKL